MSTICNKRPVTSPNSKKNYMSPAAYERSLAYDRECRAVINIRAELYERCRDLAETCDLSIAEVARTLLEYAFDHIELNREPVYRYTIAFRGAAAEEAPDA